MSDPIPPTVEQATAKQIVVYLADALDVPIAHHQGMRVVQLLREAIAAAKAEERATLQAALTQMSRETVSLNRRLVKAQQEIARLYAATAPDSARASRQPPPEPQG